MCILVLQSKEEIVRWEEGKKWQAKMDKVKNSVKEKERENESMSKQLSTLKDLYARSVWISYHSSSSYPLCMWQNYFNWGGGGRGTHRNDIL